MMNNSFSLVALNFSDQYQTVAFIPPFSGDYKDELHGFVLPNLIQGVESSFTVPSNYGCIWTLQ
jgi:hypothetical protein